MKALFYTLLILGGAFVAYDYYLAPKWERVIFEKSARPSASAVTQPKGHVEAETQGLPESNADPVAAVPSPAKSKADDYVPSIPKIPSGEFEPPQIASVETITKNWTSIPKQAFPRPVILKKDVQVKMSVGASIIRAGATAFALAADNGLLTIAPTETSTARGSTSVMDTDFPDQIHASYEKWKQARIDQLRQAWLTRKTGQGKDRSTLANGQGVTFGADGRPAQNADGSYNLLLAVISSGQITDVDPAQVTHWGAPQQENIDGKPTWVINVSYKAKTIFGLMDVESYAQVRDGRLVRWIYPSGEPLP